MAPPVPCELIRGYLNFLPHAWNVIIIKKGDSWVRMVVDACRPHDIREETDPEYFCRSSLSLLCVFVCTSAYVLDRSDNRVHIFFDKIR